MILSTPIQQKERTVIVDVIRGFALIGVLIANFTSYIDQQTPEKVLESISSPTDLVLMRFNTIFLEWKFMNLFSILFGYGFGLILESLEKKQIDPNIFFAKRMFWLFAFGIIHSLFWWGDVLNLYAMSGILLLLFRKKSSKFILVVAVLFMFLFPVVISFLCRNLPDTFTESDIQGLFEMYKNGKLSDIFIFNIDFYYRMFVVSGANFHDITETLGRFLFGYFLLRKGLFQNVDTKNKLFRNAALIALPVMIIYFYVRWQLLNNHFQVNRFLLSPFMSIGILSATSFYVCILVLAYNHFGLNLFFRSLQVLGKMTLSNYLLISAFLVILLYGIGFNQLGELAIHEIWLYAAGWMIFEVIFSTYWLKIFRYGPAEWVWRQLTYWKRLPLRK